VLGAAGHASFLPALCVLYVLVAGLGQRPAAVAQAAAPLYALHLAAAA